MPSQYLLMQFPLTVRPKVVAFFEKDDKQEAIRFAQQIARDANLSDLTLLTPVSTIARTESAQKGSLFREI